MKKYLSIMALAMMVTAAPAQARYLHVADARAAAEQWLPGWAKTLKGQPGSIGTCRHLSKHIVLCKYTVVGLTVDGLPDWEWDAWATAVLHGSKIKVSDRALAPEGD